MVGPIALLLMFLIKRYRTTRTCGPENRQSEEQKEQYKKTVPKKTILVCISLVFAFGIMSENMYTDFSATFFQFQPTLRLSAGSAAEMFSTMAIALSVGRGLSIFIALWIKAQHMIGFQMAIVFFGYVYQILGQNQLIHLWISGIVICFGYSSIFISLFSFVGQYMEVTDRIGGLFIGSNNAIYLFLPYFVSRYIETIPSSFLYIEIASLSVAVVAFAAVLLAVRRVPQYLITKVGYVVAH